MQKKPGENVDEIDPAEKHPRCEQKKRLFGKLAIIADVASKNETKIKADDDNDDINLKMIL